MYFADCIVQSDNPQIAIRESAVCIVQIKVELRFWSKRA